MRGMEQQRSRKEEGKEMIELNIKEFIAAARLYLFGLLPAQPQLATVRIQQPR